MVIVTKVMKSRDKRHRQRPCGKFNGTEQDGVFPDFLLWFAKFEVCVEKAPLWNKLAELKMHLEKDAEWAVFTMSAEVQGDYALLVDELKKLYPPQYTPNQAFDEFATRKQLPNESVSAYASHLRHMLSMTDASESMFDYMLTNRFKTGLIPRLYNALELRSVVTDKHKPSFDQLVEIARRLEYIHKTEKPEDQRTAQMAKPPPVKQTQASGPQRPAAQQQQMSNWNQQRPAQPVRCVLQCPCCYG